MFIRKIFFFSLFIIIPIYSYPKNNVAKKTDSTGIYQLSQIVVTATRTKISAAEIGSSISVIDSSEIANANGADLIHLLGEQYGLAVSQSGGPGQLAEIYLRGAAPGQTLVEVDGVKMNMPDDVNNSYDFSFIPLDNVKRIEILRGPQSTLYGSDAMAGIINIITKQGSDKPRYLLNIEGGSLNTYKTLLGMSGSYEQTNYSLSFSKSGSKGVSAADQSFGNTEPDGYNKYNASSQIGLNLSDNTKLSLFAQFNKGLIDLDQSGGKYGDDPTYVYKHEQGIYHAEVNTNILKNKWRQKLGLSFMRNLRRYSFDSTLHNPASSRSFYQGNSYQLDWQNNFRFIPHNLITFGIEADKENMSSSYEYNSSSNGNYISNFPNKSLTTISAYLQNQFNVSNTSFTTAGIRYDKISKFGSDVTFRITQAYLIKNTGTKLKADFGTGSKAPSLYDLYDPNYGNHNLKSERSTGWEAGIEQYITGFNMLIGINYFKNNFTNLFGYNADFRTININKVSTRGAEIYLSAKIKKSFSVNANYTYTKVENISVGNSDQNLSSIIRRPKNKASIQLNYTFLKHAGLGMNLNYFGKRYDLNFSTYPAEKIQLPDYTLLSVSASYRFTNYLQLYGIIKNAANKNYEEVYGYGTPGRTSYLGIKLDF